LRTVLNVTVLLALTYVCQRGGKGIMPGTVIGRIGSLFLFGIGIVWLLIWLILAYSSKQKSTQAVLAVFS